MFLIFALITLIGAVALVFQRNLVVAGLCLVLSFMGVSGLFLLLANPVAAALQIIVYSGAIVVLLLFVIMLLNSHQEEPPVRRHLPQRILAILAGLVLAAGAVKAVLASKALQVLDATPLPPAMDLNRVGLAIFGNHMVAFEAAGLLLLAAMICAIALVKRDL